MVRAWHSTEVLLSHRLGTAASAGQCPGLLAQGSRCHREMCCWAARGCKVSAPCTREDPGVWAVVAAGNRPGRAGGGCPWGLAPPGRCRRAPGCWLTELADVPVSGLAALVIPVEGSRRLHLHAVPKAVPRQEGGEASQHGGTAVTPRRGRVSSGSGRHLPLVVWLPESKAGEGGWLAHVPAEGSLGCLVGETWGSRRWGGNLPAPWAPHTLPTAVTHRSRSSRSRNRCLSPCYQSPSG